MRIGFKPTATVMIDQQTVNRDGEDARLKGRGRHDACEICIRDRDEPVVVRRVPDVSDTNFRVQIMGQLGASVERSSGNVRVEARSLHSEAAYEMCIRDSAMPLWLSPSWLRSSPLRRM